MFKLPNFDAMYRDMADTPQLSRGQVWCKSCGTMLKVNSAQCLKTGWPKCCGYTMTLDSPEEQAAFKAATDIKFEDGKR